MQIYCTGCSSMVEARLTDGREMYPHREDLAELPFWIHDACGAFVGTHNKTKNIYKPLGFLATKEVKRWRKAIHAMLDPLWLSKKIGRNKAYKYIGRRLGRVYHTAQVYSVDDAKKVYEIVLELKEKLDPRVGPWDN